MFNFKEYLVEKQIIVNNSLVNMLGAFPLHNRLMEAVKYSLMAGGKRIRPILCIAACEAVHGDFQKVLPVACAIEMIHTYSLIHDDLPAMDNDDLRRGKPTCHIQFDEATAILAGDALLTLAFQILSSEESTQDHNNENHDAVTRLKIINILSNAAGCNGMVEGQMLDISSEEKLLDLDELEDMHSLKTGALIEASVSTGAISGGCNDRELEHLVSYAKKTGLAFQIIDDILDVEGDPLLMGKCAGVDENRNKNTYPSLMGLENSKRSAKKLVSDALSLLDIFDNSADALRKIADYILNRNK